jgi:hypothetical protein
VLWMSGLLGLASLLAFLFIVQRRRLLAAGG